MLSLFRSVLGAQIDSLAPVLRHHYDVMPGERTESVGELETWNRLPFLRHLIPFLPSNQKRVEVRLINIGAQDKRGRATLEWHREFKYPDRSVRMVTINQTAPTQLACPCVLDRTVPPRGPGSAVTMMLEPSADHEALAQVAIGPQYLALAGRLFPQPWMARSKVEAVEHAIDLHNYYVDIAVSHPIFGRIFGYRGRMTLLGNV